MAKQKFDIIQSTCIPIQIDNCNTDLIIPARYLASTTRDAKFFGDAFMHDLRFDAEGNPVKDFVMNQEDFAEAPSKGVHEIIIGGQNWGSGSSREHAALAPLYLGVKAVVTKSFARIHRSNLINAGILPLTFKNEADYEKISENDDLKIENVIDAIKTGADIVIENVTTGDKIECTCELSERAKDIVLAGGLLSYTREQLN